MGFFDKIKKTVSDVFADIKSEITDDEDDDLGSLVGGLGKSLDDLTKGMDLSELGKGLGLGKSAQSMLGGLASSLTKPSEKPASSAARQPAPQPAPKPASKPSSQPAPQPAPKPASGTQSTGTTPFMFNSQIALDLVKACCEQAEIDGDGDIVVRFDVGNAAQYTKTMFVYVYPDRLVYDLVVKYKENLGDMDAGRKKIERDYSDITLKIDPPRVRLKLTQSVKGKSVDDIEAIIMEYARIGQRLDDAMSDFMKAYGEAQTRQQKVLRFTTAVVEDWLKHDGVKDYTIDSDGDIQVKHSYAKSYRFKWFVWYVISDDTLTIDAGMSTKPSWLDPYEMRDGVNNVMNCEYVKAVVNDNGSLRFKAKISGGLNPDFEKVAKAWIGIHSELNTLFAGVADTDAKYEEAEEKRRRASSSSHTSSSSSSTSSSSSRSSSSSSSSSATSAKAAEQERKHKEKEEKERKKKVIDDKIKRLQNLIDGYNRNIKDWSTNSNPGDLSTRQAIQGAKEAIRRLKDDIADLRKQKANL